MAGNFDGSTRRVYSPTNAMARPVGGGTTFITLPKVGLLARVWLVVTGAVSGTLSAPNAAGFSSILNRVRLTANSGVDIFNVSGPGFHWLLRNMLENYSDPVPGSNGRTAVTAASYDISLVIPVAMNDRDPIGLVNLQSEQVTLTLSLDWLADASVATGATVTGTATPYLEFFTVPTKPDDYPPLNIVHQCIEDSQAISAAGDFTYNWPRGNTYLQVLHACAINTTPADSWSRARVRVNQSNFIQDYVPLSLSMEYAAQHPAARILGTIPLDYMGTSGLGMYGKARDMLDSSQLTDLATIITATAAATLTTVRRQLVTLG